MIKFAAIVPHAPETVAEIGKKGDLKLLKQTIKSLDQLRIELEETNPDLLVVITPHLARENPYSFCVNATFSLRGNFRPYGCSKELEFRNDLSTVSRILYETQASELFEPVRVKSDLDYGALVPLYHLTKNIHPRIVHVSACNASLQMHYDYGCILGNICQASEKNVAVIASGDLSHRLLEKNKGELVSGGNLFDQEVITSLTKNNVDKLIHFDQKLDNDAQECGLRSIVTMLGVISGMNYKFHQYSYEGPKGVGYLVARLV